MKLRWSALLAASAVEGKRLHEDRVTSPASLGSDRRLQNDRECVDRNPNCKNWASIGECLRNPGFMSSSCARACDECGPIASPMPTLRPTVRPTAKPTLRTCGIDNERTKSCGAGAGDAPQSCCPGFTCGNGKNNIRCVEDTVIKDGDGDNNNDDDGDNNNDNNDADDADADADADADGGDGDEATTDPLCMDRNPNCELWASIGECLRNPSFMSSNCPKACNTCGAAATVLPTSRPTMTPTGPPTINPTYLATTPPTNKVDDEDDEDEDEDEDEDDRKEPSGGRFRLEMYCETKYRWQGKEKCPDYCLEYSKCSSGGSIKIRDCDKTSKQKWWKDGSVLRPDCDGGNKLCVSGETLKTCDTKLNFDSKGSNKFEIRKGSGLLTQHHHPRDGEEVGFRNMAITRKNNTNLWKKA